MEAIDVNLILGPLLVGILFNTYLYGLVTYQFAAYYKTNFNDPLAIKFMVLFLFLLDTVHSAAVMWMLWVYCVAGYGDPSTLAIAPWPYTFTPIATALASMVTQVFLGWRIYRFSRSRVLFALVICLSVTACVLGVVCGTRAWIIKYVAKVYVLTNLVTAWLVLQVTADLFVTGTLGYLLARSRTGFQKTDTVINRLIRGAVQTGLFAVVFSLGDLIGFTIWPNTNFYGMFAIPIGRIYTNTLLDTLLTRLDLRQQLNETINVDATGAAPSLLQFAENHHGNTTAHHSTHIPLGDISVRKEVVVFRDVGGHDHSGSVVSGEMANDSDVKRSSMSDV
ncbi:hypothetical protein BC835DRAFT_1358287 [Cytidiella melzeri]|nr:hypothetical protein BC835DRAFT_1358287 [Cytidiella melzeri]